MTAAVPPLLSPYQARVDAELERLAPGPADEHDVVRRAMRYTLLAPSKKVRAVLALLAAELCGGGPALQAAAAVEMVHAASLILDDLPAMDNAPLRRGQPANHLVFGEATAILAAFGLLTLAFESIARAYDAGLARRLVLLLAEAVGLDGLVAGQAEDLAATERDLSFDTLVRIHHRKTGALFHAAAAAGALTAGASSDQLAALSAYARNLGLAFQIIDDLLDVTGRPEATGKAVRHDARKTTFVSFSGADGARQLAAELCATADAALAPFGRRAEPLRALSAFVAGRAH